VAVGESTVYRTKRRFVEMGLEAALNEQARPGAQRKLSGKEEALLIATACTNPPSGRARWTLELLADTFVKLTEHEELSRETVRRRLAENDLKPWRKDMWCIPKIDAEYVARMEDVLDLYAETPDPQHPVVCFDESPTQLIGEVRQPIPAEPGKPLRYDCEYKRNGTANVFVFLDAHRSWRKVKVTELNPAPGLSETAEFGATPRERRAPDSDCRLPLLLPATRTRAGRATDGGCTSEPIRALQVRHPGAYAMSADARLRPCTVH